MLSLPWPVVEHGEDIRKWESRRGESSKNKTRQNGKCVVGMEQLLDSRPDSLQYAVLLRRCAQAKSLLQGMLVHAHMLRSIHGSDLVLNNLLVQMYGQCGSLQDARLAFERIQAPNVFSWNMMLSAYTQNGHHTEALALFERMKLECRPDKVTLLTVLRAVSNLGALREGKLVHANALVTGLESNQIVASSLMNMYGKCGSAEEARRVFDRMPRRDIITWNTMIAAYTQNGHYSEALDLYRRLSTKGGDDRVKPDSGTFVVALHACAGLSSADDGREIHGHMLSGGGKWNVIAYTALVTMYGKCGCLDEAKSVFEGMENGNVVTWTALIEAYAQHGQHAEAIELYKTMKIQGIKVDKVVVTIVLGACSSLKDIELGQDIHAQIEANNLEVDSFVACALVDMYTSCGMFDTAKAWVWKQDHVFVWNALIYVYTQHGRTREALQVYAEMPNNVTPNKDTFSGILNTCACIGAPALIEGKSIHARIMAKSVWESDIAISSALINMYSKCGCLENAKSVFNNSKRCNVVFWSSMIAAYARQGHIHQVFLLVQEMCQIGLNPNKITFEAVLQATKLPLKQGQWHFLSMIQDYGLFPSYEHYARIVHLLTCVGKLEEAHELIQNMPFVPGARVWTSLLHGCGIFDNPQLKKLAAEQLLQLGKYYAGLGMWNKVMDLRNVIQQEMKVESHNVKNNVDDEDRKNIKKSSKTKDPVLRSPSYRPLHLDR